MRRGHSRSATRRRRESRSRVRRDDVGCSPRPRTESMDGSRPSQSHALSADALARLDRDHARSVNQEPRRDRDRDRERNPDGNRVRERERERERRDRRRRRRDGRDENDASEARPKARAKTMPGNTVESKHETTNERTPPRVWRHDYRGLDRVGREDGKKRKSRLVTGALLEDGGKTGDTRGDGDSRDSLDKHTDEHRPVGKDRRRTCIYMVTGVVVTILLAVIIAVAVTVGRKKTEGDDGDPRSDKLQGLDASKIPAGAPSWLNPLAWADTTDFNLTYTDQTVGDLPIMGLHTHWDDSAQANERVPALNRAWGGYGSRPARGVNVGGWLSLEPFITPSLFDYDSSLGIVDEHTLCLHLGTRCEATLERHYAGFVTEQTFRDVAAAGLDHVRIPFSYWAVETYAGDGFVYRTSWRYLLRGIEWARKYGLRVNLDLHALPGSQNGWNHSGRQGVVGWLNGTDGDGNARRSLHVHRRLSLFFAQDRYRNVISHYGLANEPRMTALSSEAVLEWTSTAYSVVRGNGVEAVLVLGDGFRGLDRWQGELQHLSGVALDVHQYVIFNTNQIVFNHSEKVAYACDGWTEQTTRSMNPATGFGPTLVAEWSQADSDCARHLTNVGWGNRWEGTYRTGNATTDILTPRCPLRNAQCRCDGSNAPASSWTTEYKHFLLMFAEAQMTSFEKGWGWFYWVWDTESA